MKRTETDDGGGAPLPGYMSSPSVPGLPPGVTQAMIDASLAANPNASKGGYEGTPYPTDGSSIATGGDPNNWMQTDPSYQALLSALHGNEGAFSAQMRAQIQRDALRSGYDIPELGQFLDAGMLDQMKNDPNSLRAMSQQGHGVNLRNIQNQLAARGGYNSGELTYGIGNEDQRFNQEGLSQRGALLDEIRALLGQQAQLQGSDASQLAGALGDAAQRQATLHPVGTAHYDSSTGSYIDQYGNHFNQDGTPFGSPPKAPAPAPTPPAQFTPLPNQGTGPYIGTGGPNYAALSGDINNQGLPRGSGLDSLQGAPPLRPGDSAAGLVPPTRTGTTTPQPVTPVAL